MEEHGDEEREAPYEAGDDDRACDEGCRCANEVPLRCDDDMDVRRDLDAGEADLDGPAEGVTAATRRSEGAEMGRGWDDRRDVRSCGGGGWKISA